jgi:hypothetical protein
MDCTLFDQVRENVVKCLGPNYTNENNKTKIKVSVDKDKELETWHLCFGEEEK